MSADIVERLKKPAPKFGLEEFDPTYDVRQDGAAEITRLRAALAEKEEARLAVCAALNHATKKQVELEDALAAEKEARVKAEDRATQMEVDGGKQQHRAAMAEATTAAQAGQLASKNALIELALVSLAKIAAGTTDSLARDRARATIAKLTAVEPAALPAGGVTGGIYIASKTTHGARWRDLRASGVPIISTWIDEAEVGATSNWPDLWHRCVREASQAAATIVYREEGEVLKGAFVEMGAALAAGRTVFAVGCDEFSVRHHMRVVPCASLEEAIELAAALSPATATPSAKEPGHA